MPAFDAVDGSSTGHVSAMDLTTGSVGATVTWFNPKTDTLLMRMNYELICKPLQPLSEGCPYSNFANNLFASCCDSRRPTICFATFHLPGSS